MVVTVDGVGLTTGFIGLHTITVYTLYNTTALQIILTEYHGRVFTRQGPGPPADPLTSRALLRRLQLNF
jgi:hypothetical protein